MICRPRSIACLPTKRSRTCTCTRPRMAATCAGSRGRDLPVGGLQRAALAGDDREELAPGAQREAERLRQGVAANRELANFSRDAPHAAAAGREERHGAGPEAALDVVLVGYPHLAGDDVHGLVDAVVPVEPAGGGRPRD